MDDLWLFQNSQCSENKVSSLIHCLLTFSFVKFMRQFTTKLADSRKPYAHHTASMQVDNERPYDVNGDLEIYLKTDGACWISLKIEVT